MPDEIKIMVLTGPSFLINYNKQEVPPSYYCSCCNKRGRQWRRRDDNRASVELYCVKCKTEYLGNDAVPVIPLRDNTAYHMFEETPPEANGWWYRLPSLFKQRY